MAGSFAQLAKNAEKKKPLIAVSKEAVKNPPLKIYMLGQETLRTPANRIVKVDDSIRKLAKDMLITMYSAKGIGLAAPQVGVQKRILVIDLNFEEPESPPNVFINPEIISSSASVDTYEEGCLSIPGVYLNVVRPSSIKLSYRDEMGRPKKMNAEGLMARCIQHEIDHLNGVLFVDKVSDEEELKKQLNENNFNQSDVRKETN
ncbi:peptide deformylase [Prochlorococcus sp. MIT 1011]|uniref:peptide deformylase n=1 Tax=Prochlorococcus sp. MIT 1011 TaxID=3082520 RepID=UPI0039B4B0AA